MIPSAYSRETLQRRHALDNLERANVVRLEHARVKRDLKAGRVRLGALLAAPPESIHSMRVVDLLIAVPRWGRRGTGATLTRLNIEARTVGELTVLDRARLIRHHEEVRCPTPA